ncbi:Beta-1,4-mannosyl-glycoprotein 4-beta-N-acetylglucosaminyltransferase [Pseudocercospora fuligena]|uniref:Beta-1,4-mannosyl-glycoprotein 4-beta-N-acetylglucosaminyltransferase n=1 Tax=Pseudocercospora fuligena TaxID=685502 RepID=A0A8H6RSZ3_9PEZI|nr:Beta-1,4-mannosyl-glycoprotein 4-beta-N-acetylglucosaminyltransferase [Pseudocercospora fuligena]
MITSLGLGRRGYLVTFTAISLILLFVTFNGHGSRRPDRPVPPHVPTHHPKAPESAAELKALCKTRGFSPYQAGPATHRKVYDLFLFSHELDWLEIRLNTMAPYVDYFVIVEAPTTFTGVPKPLHLQDNWSRFSQFHGQIIHKVVTDPGKVLGTSTWTHEDFFRDSLFNSVFPTLLYSEKEAQEGDVLLISDVDEIPKPDTLNVLRHCQFPDRLTLRSRFYYYSFQWLHIGEEWPHPQATTYHGLSETLTPNHLRNGVGSVSRIPFWSALLRWYQKTSIPDAAWHCSSCFSTIEEMRTKMSSFSHTPLNTEENRDEKTMLERVRKGLDLFGRAGERYARVENNQDVPKYILDHGAKFKYLLNRDGEDAGFTDWTPPGDWLKSD